MGANLRSALLQEIFKTISSDYIDLKKSTLTTRAPKLNKNTMTIHILIGDIDLYDTGFREKKTNTVNNVFGAVQSRMLTGPPHVT